MSLCQHDREVEYFILFHGHVIMSTWQRSWIFCAASRSCHYVIMTVRLNIFSCVTVMSLCHHDREAEYFVLLHGHDIMATRPWIWIFSLFHGCHYVNMTAKPNILSCFMVMPLCQHNREAAYLSCFAVMSLCQHDREAEYFFLYRGHVIMSTWPRTWTFFLLHEISKLAVWRTKNERRATVEQNVPQAPNCSCRTVSRNQQQPA